MRYKYLVASALQEELKEFLTLFKGEQKRINHGVIRLTLEMNGKNVDILAFSTKKMGMLFNAAKLMEIIKIFNPRVTLFIGVCAIFKSSKHELGTVIIPHKVFSYESGKFQDDKFLPDYYSYDTSDLLRGEAIILQPLIKHNYKVLTDEDFCSGAAVINDPEKVRELEHEGLKGGRKVIGLDMEAFSIVCINQILKPANELLIIKGASDFAKEKDEAENLGKRQEAKENAANFAKELIEHLEKNEVIKTPDERLEMTARAKEEGINASFNLKIIFNIKNVNPFPVTIKSKSFVFKSSSISLGFKAGRHNKPLFKIGKKMSSNKEVLEDDYKEVYTLEPNETVLGCWLPVDPSLGIHALNISLRDKAIGVWNYKCYHLKEEVEVLDYEHQF